MSGVEDGEGEVEDGGERVKIVEVGEMGVLDVIV